MYFMTHGKYGFGKYTAPTSNSIIVWYINNHGLDPVLLIVIIYIIIVFALVLLTVM